MSVTASTAEPARAGDFAASGQAITSATATAALHPGSVSISARLDPWPQMLWIARADGYREWFNARWYEYTGGTPEQTLGDGWSAWVHPDDREMALSRWRNAVASGEIFEMEYRLRRASDGQYHWHLARGTPSYDAEGKIDKWYGVSIDIHKLTEGTLSAKAAAASTVAQLSLQAREAERRLARQLEFTRGITDSLAVGLYCVDNQGRSTFVNPAAEHLLGYEPGELLGKEMHETIHHQHADHSAFPREQCPLLAVVQTGKIVRMDDDVFTRKDGSLLPVQYQSAPIMEDGSIIGAVVSFQDITERKRNVEMLRRYNDELEQRVQERTGELRQANARLAVSNRELQDFASVASHDLQEPLRKIQAFGDRLAARASSALGPEGADYLRRMKSAAGRMQTLISDLLSFSRVTTRAQPFVPVNLAIIVGEVMLDLETSLEKNGGNVEIGSLPTIDADPTQMRQLLQNLVGNALKFRKPDEPSRIRIYATLDERPSEQGQPIAMCQLHVEDNGIGFDEKYLDRIFNVFQRLHTRTDYEGTGIGLAVCRKIAERHGGSITAKSQPGVGSTFIVTLPVHQDQATAAPRQQQQEETYAG